MQYLCLIYSSETTRPKHGTEEFGPLMQAYKEFGISAKKDGVLLGGEALQPVATAKTVTRESGTQEVTDGPFAETKEQLGGYYLLECKDMEEAVKYASNIPGVNYGRVEVRPVMSFDW